MSLFGLVEWSIMIFLELTIKETVNLGIFSLFSSDFLGFLDKIWSCFSFFFFFLYFFESVWDGHAHLLFGICTGLIHVGVLVNVSVKNYFFSPMKEVKHLKYFLSCRNFRKSFVRTAFSLFDVWLISNFYEHMANLLTDFSLIPVFKCIIFL